ncbi:multidrug efflux SMR transporter [Boseongicola sp. H5]|uniref:DMT family transporter n=1 Tax=Rhodobacterales TaxID=204455 RepID=UPI001B2976A4|nr:SMR family transporter [Boseongicola sp. H5]MBO6922734.1 QacE family quaternary ammonium compound efflux SMR transporter [Roseicyclus sp.]
MHWLYLIIAVLFEISVAIAAGKSEGFKNVKWTVITLVSGVIATIFLSLALLTFDVGVGYSMWTSLAGVGIVILGAVFLNQRLNFGKVTGIAIVISGVIGLRLSGAA